MVLSTKPCLSQRLAQRAWYGLVKLDRLILNSFVTSIPCFRHVLYCLVPNNVQLHSCHKYIACARNHPCPCTNSVLQKILTHAQAIRAQKACAQDLQCSSKLVLQTTLAHTSFLSSESLCFKAPWPAHKFFELGKLVLQSTLAHAQPF